MNNLAAGAAFAVMTLFANTARADDKGVVTTFYTQVLSGTTAADLADRVNKVIASDWQSIGGYAGAPKTREQFTQQLQGFGKLIPDLTWKIEEIVREGDRYVVRGRATGTPAGEFFGVAPTGKRFDIMSIDIHTVKGGKIVKTYHVEDWAGAIRQLRAQ